MTANLTPDPIKPPGRPSTYEPLLDPHHLQLILVGKRIKVLKFEKNPNPKLRRNYKDMTAIEVTIECLARECEKLNEALSGNGKVERASSKQSARRSVLGRKNSTTTPGSRSQTKRQETPDLVNINIQAPGA